MTKKKTSPASDPQLSDFSVGDRVCCERDETRWPSRGTWPKYRGKYATVITINTADAEIGVTFNVAKERPNGSLTGSGGPTWFLPHELRHARGGQGRSVAPGSPETPKEG